MKKGIRLPVKQTKIIATIGPATSSVEMLERLILEGMNVIRINASHGDIEGHKEVIKNCRIVDKKLSVKTAILVDLQGPKLRVGDIVGGEMLLEDDSELKIKVGEELGSGDVVYTNYANFALDVKAGEPVLLDDGKLRLEVLATDNISEVICRVINGGILRPRKGLNLPKTIISLPCITDKDKVDLDFALEENVDWIGLSFVRNSSDIEQLQAVIKQRGKHAKVVAKIEKPEAVEDIDNIIMATDAVMIARGDLGVEVPMQDVPLIQKDVIAKCLTSSKPVIVATQMMESMIESATPTRAEVNDVANAVLDGADAVMLSAETSVGKHPINAVQSMTKIIQSMEEGSEKSFNERPPYNPEDERFITDSVCYNACRLARRAKAKAIVTMTYSGYTAQKVSSQRPKANIFMLTSNHKVLGQMNLVWGVRTIYYSKLVSTDHTIAEIKQLLIKEGLVEKGDFVIHTASMPIADMGMTNMLKLSRV
jgi:pyruvate kinase